MSIPRKCRDSVAILISLVTAALPSAAAALTPPPATSTTLKIRWPKTQDKPDRIVLDARSAQIRLNEASGYHIGQTPPSSEAAVKLPMIAHYGDASFTLYLTIAYGHPPIEFELPRPALPYCHANYVTKLQQRTYEANAAVKAMLEAHHLLQMPSTIGCSDQNRRKLIAARLERNYDASRWSGYVAINPKFQEEYASLAAGSAAQLANLELISREALGIEAREIYAAQQSAQSRDDWEVAAALNAHLSDRALEDEAWQSALQSQKLGPDRLRADAAFLGTMAVQKDMAAQATAAPATEAGPDPD